MATRAPDIPAATGNPLMMSLLTQLRVHYCRVGSIDLNIPAQRVIRVLDRIVAHRGYPLKLRMDNGPEFISLALA